MIKLVNKFLGNFNIRLIKLMNIKELERNNNFLKNENDNLKKDFLFFQSDRFKNNLNKLTETHNKSRSQLGQDLFVLNHFNFKKKGFFVEFGATNGIDLSNSYLLEKHFNWRGIVVEPCKTWHKDLFKNRNCQIDLNCVWKSSDSKLNFFEVEDAEFSTIAEFNNSDHNTEIRSKRKEYQVSSISLNDLLIKYNAPKEIDYLSVDTEGSEYEILKNFNFKEYSVKVITVEHNFSDMRIEILKLLSENGYKRELTSISKWDDWYVLTNNNFS